jgi:CubicO group peptidase (beta-lactamase class C family)
MRTRWHWGLAVLVLGRGVAAEDAPPAGPVPGEAPLSAAAEVTDVGRLLEPILARHGLPALGGAVVTAEAHGVVASGTVGLRAVGSPEAATREDLWHIGSCTKSMTATVAARLVERGRLRFETALSELFTTVEVHPALASATLRHLLAHRAGLGPAYPPAVWAYAWQTDEPGRSQRVRGAAAALVAPPAYEVGARAEYSNVGFDLAGAAMEALEDRAYEDLAREQLFDPLGMTSAGFGAPGSAEEVDQPRGHRKGGRGFEAVRPGRGADNPPILSPAGRVHLTLEDWGRYVAMHLREVEGTPVRGGEEHYLSPETLQRIHTPERGEDYAYGWAVTARPWAGGRTLTHSGSNTMWFAVCWLAPERGFAVLAVCNAGGDAAAKACDDVSSTLIQWHLAR